MNFVQHGYSQAVVQVCTTTAIALSMANMAVTAMIFNQSTIGKVLFLYSVAGNVMLANSHTHAELSLCWLWLTIGQVIRKTARRSCTPELAVPAEMYLCCNNATTNAGTWQQQEAIAIKGNDTPALSRDSDCICLVLNFTSPQNNVRVDSSPYGPCIFVMQLVCT